MQPIIPVWLSLFPERANGMAIWQLSFKIGMAIYQKQQDVQTAACHSQSSSAANSTYRPDSLQSSKLDSFNVSPSIRVEELNARDGNVLPNILDLKNQLPGISAANPEISAASLGISAANFFDFQ